MFMWSLLSSTKWRTRAIASVSCIHILCGSLHVPRQVSGDQADFRAPIHAYSSASRAMPGSAQVCDSVLPRSRTNGAAASPRALQNALQLSIRIQSIVVHHDA
jgi:hypothetical protein